MSDVKIIYHDELKENKKEEYWFWITDYAPMIKSFGNVVISVDEENYQGDSWVLYDNDGKVGYLEFGWGSCSGCDALQACTSVKDLQDLCDELEQDIKWFDSYKDALLWFTEHDWEGDWSSQKDECKQFVQQAINYLKGKC